MAPHRSYADGRWYGQDRNEGLWGKMLLPFIISILTGIKPFLLHLTLFQQTALIPSGGNTDLVCPARYFTNSQHYPVRGKSCDLLGYNPFTNPRTEKIPARNISIHSLFVEKPRIIGSQCLFLIISKNHSTPPSYTRTFQLACLTNKLMRSLWRLG